MANPELHTDVVKSIRTSVDTKFKEKFEKKIDELPDTEKTELNEAMKKLDMQMQKEENNTTKDIKNATEALKIVATNQVDDIINEANTPETEKITFKDEIEGLDENHKKALEKLDANTKQSFAGLVGEIFDSVQQAIPTRQQRVAAQEIGHIDEQKEKHIEKTLKQFKSA